jgi:hypothetical protein
VFGEQERPPRAQDPCREAFQVRDVDEQVAPSAQALNARTQEVQGTLDVLEHVPEGDGIESRQVGRRVCQHSTEHLAAAAQGGGGTLAEHRRRLDSHHTPTGVRGRAQKRSGGAAHVEEATGSGMTPQDRDVPCGCARAPRPLSIV